MAKIVHSEQAPAEQVEYTFGNAEPFKLGGRTKTYTTQDQEIIAGAETHPWLRVERDEDELFGGQFAVQLDPKDDVLSAQNSIANDADEARKAEEAKGVASGPAVALDAGETQTEVVETEGVAETLAADDSSKTSDKVKD